MELSSNLISCVQQTEGAIAPDLPPEWDAESVAECCIDAGRMTMFCGDNGTVAHQEIRDLIATHGYEAVLSAIAPHVSV